MINAFTKLAKRHLVLTEERQGLQQCHVTLHNLIHLPEDVERFGSPDNYWCFSFERAVKRFVRHKTNFKNIELSYAKAECRREFHKVQQHMSTSIQPTFDRELVSA